VFRHARVGRRKANSDKPQHLEQRFWAGYKIVGEFARAPSWAAFRVEID